MKVAFIGTHGVGKTTLCFELAALLKKRDKVVEMVREVARFCPLPINRDTTVAAQSWILHTEIAEELVAENKAEIVICDRSVLDNYCYLLQTGQAADARAARPVVDRTRTTSSSRSRSSAPSSSTACATWMRPSRRTVDEKIDEVLAEWSVPRPAARQGPPRAPGRADSLDAILPLLGPVQQPLFESADEVEKPEPFLISVRGGTPLRRRPGCERSPRDGTEHDRAAQDRQSRRPFAEKQKDPERVRDRLEHSDERCLRGRARTSDRDEEGVRARELEDSEEAEHRAPDRGERDRSLRDEGEERARR